MNLSPFSESPMKEEESRRSTPAADFQRQIKYDILAYPKLVQEKHYATWCRQFKAQGLSEVLDQCLWYQPSTLVAAQEFLPPLSFLDEPDPPAYHSVIVHTMSLGFPKQGHPT